ncbi:MAG: hypothetical protein NDI61_04355 [Bdellovibrionaceae bacterium]|nr:hypothetical protein [Pseudobdellovibrionaceae bacterium]
MKTSTRINLILTLVIATTISAIAFQNCSPAEFSQGMDATKADPLSVIGTEGDGLLPTTEGVAVGRGGENTGGNGAGNGSESMDVVQDPNLGQLPITDVVKDPSLGNVDIPMVTCPAVHDDEGDGVVGVEHTADTHQPGAMSSLDGQCAVLCHYAAGDKEKGRTLYVGINAVRAHLDNHGDTVGPCAAAAQ